MSDDDYFNLTTTTTSYYYTIMSSIHVGKKKFNGINTQKKINHLYCSLNRVVLVNML